MKPRAFLKLIGANITNVQAATILQTSSIETAKILNRWTTQGWLIRIGRGLYATNPASSNETSALDNSLSIVPAIMGKKGYVCGWSAAEHWGITEQIFNDISIASYKWKRPKKIALHNCICFVFSVSSESIIGTQVLWYQDQKVLISDLHKTILDILARPGWGGGLAHSVDCFRNYLTQEKHDVKQILDYAEQIKVKGVFYKRLGYLLELMGGSKVHIEHCYFKKTSGYSALDPKIPQGRLCSRWNLIIPENVKF